LLSIGVDPTRCTRCRRCEAVCEMAHGGDGRGLQSRVRIRDSGWPLISICRHCESAPCADACVSGAIRTDPLEGTVQVDAARCVGCWSCVMECPFAAVTMADVAGRGPRASKCDGCREWGFPLCVRYCPTGALRAGAGAGETSGRVRREHAARLALLPGRGTWPALRGRAGGGTPA